MAEEVFRFKRFSVSNTLAGLKVGTDGVLLGVLADLPSRKTGCSSCCEVLDIGTGTGLVALMLAQRLSGSAEITAIDINEDAFKEASANFAVSPWPDSFRCLHRSLSDFADDMYTSSQESSGVSVCWDVIVSNPPYYDESLLSPDPKRSEARHSESMSYRDVVTFAADFLAPSGRLSLVLPKDEQKKLLRFAASFGLYPSVVFSVHTVAHKPAKRIVAVLCREKCNCREVDLCLDSDEYRRLTEEFYL